MNGPDPRKPPAKPPVDPELEAALGGGQAPTGGTDPELEAALSGGTATVSRGVPKGPPVDFSRDVATGRMTPEQAKEHERRAGLAYGMDEDTNIMGAGRAGTGALLGEMQMLGGPEPGGTLPGAYGSFGKGLYDLARVATLPFGANLAPGGNVEAATQMGQSFAQTGQRALQGDPRALGGLAALAVGGYEGVRGMRGPSAGNALAEAARRTGLRPEGGAPPPTAAAPAAPPAPPVGPGGQMEIDFSRPLEEGGGRPTPPPGPPTLPIRDPNQMELPFGQPPEPMSREGALERDLAYARIWRQMHPEPTGAGPISLQALEEARRNIASRSLEPELAQRRVDLAMGPDVSGAGGLPLDALESARARLRSQLYGGAGGLDEELQEARAAVGERRAQPRAARPGAGAEEAGAGGAPQTAASAGGVGQRVPLLSQPMETTSPGVPVSGAVSRIRDPLSVEHGRELERQRAQFGMGEETPPAAGARPTMSNADLDTQLEAARAQLLKVRPRDRGPIRENITALEDEQERRLRESPAPGESFAARQAREAVPPTPTLEEFARGGPQMGQAATEYRRSLAERMGTQGQLANIGETGFAGGKPAGGVEVPPGQPIMGEGATPTVIRRAMAALGPEEFKRQVREEVARRHDPNADPLVTEMAATEEVARRAAQRPFGEPAARPGAAPTAEPAAAPVPLTLKGAGAGGVFDYGIPNGEVRVELQPGGGASYRGALFGGEFTPEMQAGIEASIRQNHPEVTHFLPSDEPKSIGGATAFGNFTPSEFVPTRERATKLQERLGQVSAGEQAAVQARLGKPSRTVRFFAAAEATEPSDALRASARKGDYRWHVIDPKTQRIIDSFREQRPALRTAERQNLRVYDARSDRIYRSFKDVGRPGTPGGAAPQYGTAAPTPTEGPYAGPEPQVKPEVAGEIKPSVSEQAALLREQASNIFEHVRNQPWMTGKKFGMTPSEPPAPTAAAPAAETPAVTPLKSRLTPDQVKAGLTEEEGAALRKYTRREAGEKVRLSATDETRAERARQKLLMRNPEAGALLVPSFHEIRGAVQRALGPINELRDAWHTLFSPAMRSPEARQTGLLLRETGSRMALQRLQMARRTSRLEGQLDKLPDAAHYSFLDRYERGLPQANSAMTQVASVVRAIGERSRALVGSLGTGKLDQFLVNYIPHLFKDPVAAQSIFTAISRGETLTDIRGVQRTPPPRRLAGSAGFLFHRDLPYTLAELHDYFGLEPRTTNPVELARYGFDNAVRYVEGQRAIKALAERGLGHWAMTPEEVPAGTIPVNDRIVGVPTEARAENVVAQRARFYAPEPVARVLNNYLSPGLTGNKFFDLSRRLGNSIVQFRLGLSAFHGTFTTLLAGGNDLGIALSKLSTGHPMEAIKQAFKAPTAPFRYFMEGNRVIKQAMSDEIGAPMGAEIDALTKAGARFGMEDYYRTGALSSFMKALRQGSMMKAGALSPFAAIEAAMYPILGHWVPRLKIGAFLETARAEMGKLNLDNVDPERADQMVRQSLAKVQDSMDNRFGQLVYDNLFWNRTLRDIGHLSVQALGWNLGSIREAFGGVADVARGDIRSTRAHFLIAYPVAIAMGNAILQYMLTGQGPQEFKDYFYPRTGRLTEAGDPERLQSPSYIRDAVGYAEHPVQTIEAKMHPEIRMVSELLNNTDFQGGMIRNPDDPLVKQAQQAAEFMLRQWEPISFAQAAKQEQAGQSGLVSALSGLGFTAAPREMVNTPAMNTMQDLLSRMGPEHITPEEREARTGRRTMLQRLSSDRSQGLQDVEAAMKSGRMTPRQAQDILVRSATNPLLAGFKRLPLDDAGKVLLKANAQERRLLLPWYMLKMQNAANSGRFDDVRAAQQLYKGLR